MQCLWRPEEGIRCAGTGANTMWVQRQPEFSTIEPFHQCSYSMNFNFQNSGNSKLNSYQESIKKATLCTQQLCLLTSLEYFEFKEEHSGFLFVRILLI